MGTGKNGNIDLEGFAQKKTKIFAKECLHCKGLWVIISMACISTWFAQLVNFAGKMGREFLELYGKGVLLSGL